jgi:hypothetical protein
VTYKKLRKLYYHTYSASSLQFHLLKSKAIPVRVRGDLQGCETSRFSHSLDNRLRDGGEFVSLTRRPRITPKEDFWYSFLLEAGSNPGPYFDCKDRIN